MILFATDENLETLDSNTHWHADGTFKACPALFYQTLTLHDVTQWSGGSLHASKVIRCYGTDTWARLGNRDDCFVLWNFWPKWRVPFIWLRRLFWINLGQNSPFSTQRGWANPYFTMEPVRWGKKWKQKTNISVEGWHRALQMGMGCDHLTIHKFIQFLRNEQNLSENKLSRTIAGENSAKVAKCKKSQARLVEILKHYGAIILSSSLRASINFDF